MLITTYKPIEIVHLETGELTKLAPGNHSLERVTNPYNYTKEWYVLAGTKLGACVEYWQDMRYGRWLYHNSLSHLLAHANGW